jgi:hypothetical protein
MKPRNKIETEIIILSKKLPAITEHKKSKIINDNFINYGRKCKVHTTCFNCGNQFKNGTKCPHCNSELKFIYNRKMSFTYDKYILLITNVKEYQIFRMFVVTQKNKFKEKIEYSFYEVQQTWINQLTLKPYLISRLINGYTNSFYKQLEIRKIIPRNFVYHDNSLITGKILPLLSKKGFTGELYKNHPITFFKYLNKYPSYETLLKLNKTHLLSQNQVELVKYWKSIKITLKNKYEITNYKLWIDYLVILEQLNIPITDPLYICPNNLTEAHDKYLLKLNKKIEANQKKERIRKIDEYSNEYIKEKKLYLNLSFNVLDLEIKVLPSVNDFYEESKVLNHCIFVNEYFKKDTLIFSARKNSIPIETIEYSLDDHTIIQSGGYKNNPSEYHDLIIKTINKNVNKIKKLTNVIRKN